MVEITTYVLVGISQSSAVAHAEEPLSGFSGEQTISNLIVPLNTQELCGSNAVSDRVV